MATFPLHEFLTQLTNDLPLFDIVVDNAAGHDMKVQEDRANELSKSLPTLSGISRTDRSCRWDTGTSCLGAPKLRVVSTKKEDEEGIMRLAQGLHAKTVEHGCLLDTLLYSRWESSSSISTSSIASAETPSTEKRDGAAKLPCRKIQEESATPKRAGVELETLLSVFEEAESELGVLSTSEGYAQLDIPPELFQSTITY